MHLIMKPGIHEARSDKIEGKKDNSAIIVVELNTPFPTIDGITRETIKEIKEVNNTARQLNLTDIHRTLHSTTEYT